MWDGVNDSYYRETQGLPDGNLEGFRSCVLRLEATDEGRRRVQHLRTRKERRAQ